ncbi:hypothetical protein, variant [Aphanomyces astaci]|uniref:Peptidase M14 domain-containing protein n=1 Tax=Aphanomyces astaci TaxID=112090 RepID=W4GQW7_APHAT|nr:hypothetical protein, variant [Aphanomyces astaci]ETV81409.1 hypothetical protein, variant [Aphanomyces astaci]|eukprot:XP_009829267.1 hypothetical protein, variant [Aphanomyces astaci]
MTRAILVLLPALCVLANASRLKSGHDVRRSVVEAHRDTAEVLLPSDDCTWKRIWRADISQQASSSDKESNASGHNTRADGSGFVIEVAQDWNGSYVSSHVVFSLEGATFPPQGKLVLRAQFPTGRGLRPVLKLVKHAKELVVVQGSSNHPTSLIVNPRVPGPTAAKAASSRLRLQDFPCLHESFASATHSFELSWDNHWLRWYVDGAFYAEAPHPTSFFTPDATYPLSVVVAVDVVGDIAPPPSSAAAAAAAFHVQDLLLLEQTSNTCTPVFVNPADCRQYSANPPRPPSSPLPPIRSGSLEGSMSLAQVYDFLNDAIPDLLSDMPHMWRNEVIGTSVEGRPIVALCLGLCHATSSPPQALYTGLHHSREPMSMMNLAFFIDHLVLGLRGHHPAITSLLWSRQLWFILVVNPDGYAYNEAHMPLHPDQSFAGQRKNRHPSTCGKAPDTGVDLNRNYDVCFSEDDVGSSDDVCGEDYRGPAAFSEPETRAVRDLVARHNFTTAFNYHSFGEYFNIPFACQPKGVPPPFAMTVFKALATDMTKLNGFKYGQSWKESNLYSVNGETSDWMWHAHGIFAMSPETGPRFDVGSFRGFWPSDPSLILAICEQLLHSNYVLAQSAGPEIELTMDKWTTIDMDNTDGGGGVAGVTLDITLWNHGLRSSSRAVEVVASVHLNGSQSSPVYSLPTLLHAADPHNAAVRLTMVVPNDNMTTSLPSRVYLVVRDGWTCSFYRICTYVSNVFYAIACVTVSCDAVLVGSKNV